MPLISKIDLLDLLAPPAGAIVWLLLSWLYARSVSLGRPLNRIQKGMIGYGLLFVLGMGYLIMFGGALSWSKASMFSMIAAWAVLVAALAGWRSKRSKYRAP
jgi:hypothetical protein